MGNNGNSERLYFLGVHGDCNHEIKRHLFLGRKAMANLVHFISVTQSCTTLRPHKWKHARPLCLSITNSWSSPKPMPIESVIPPNNLILCRPLLLPPSVFPSIRVFSYESVLHIRWPKDWSFSFSISPSNEYSGLISFRMDWMSKGVFANATVQKGQFFSTQLSLWSNSHIHP